MQARWVLACATMSSLAMLPLGGEEQKPEQDGTEIKVKVVAGLGLPMIRVAPGTFTMGSPATEPGRDGGEAQYSVNITKEYWLGRYEVTQREWQSVMESNPSRFKGDNLPVETVSWNDAMEFCGKLTERERSAGRLPEGYVYRLPTEAEWEYACRAGTTGAYAGDLDEMGWYSANSGSKTHPVGGKTPNAWGLYDMHGSVWEWCHDWHGNYPSEGVTDPTGPAGGSIRVYRGGGWFGPATRCRSADRFSSGPLYSDDGLGFRVALAAPIQ